ncbi:hypothetical protein LX87_04088 [Larkinella arboricola]|uniref:Uncharacterized protein n=1 Tax=Larkinella arboricola TaxID=643671 RepID=A0A327WRD7_LARAB|nr:hypothetical protein [Larkinella arboricola]RAJ94203.1 hypothetical protein LX87_04088 [Larkinella arboricola]
MKLSAQSTSTSTPASASDSVSHITEFVRNARAIADSLNRYEFLKIRTGQLRTDLLLVQKEKMGLLVSTLKEKDRMGECESRASVIQADLTRKTGKLKASRAENWIWRIGGTLALLKVSIDLINVLKP